MYVYDIKQYWNAIFMTLILDTTPIPSLFFQQTSLHHQSFQVHEVVGNGWHDVERNFTVRGRWMDTLIMLRHVFQEWIAPIGDDGNVDAFSYRQLVVPKMHFVFLYFWDWEKWRELFGWLGDVWSDSERTPTRILQMTRFDIWNFMWNYAKCTCKNHYIYICIYMHII